MLFRSQSSMRTKDEKEKWLKPGERIDDLQCRGYDIIQNKDVFCFGMDAVLLADFATGAPNGSVIDLIIERIEKIYLSILTETNSDYFFHSSADASSFKVRSNSSIVTSKFALASSRCSAFAIASILSSMLLNVSFPACFFKVENSFLNRILSTFPDIITVTHEKPNLISVDEVRDQLINTIDIKPYKGKYKIYIIPERIVTIDATQDIDTIHAAIVDNVEKLLAAR